MSSASLIDHRRPYRRLRRAAATRNNPAATDMHDWHLPVVIALAILSVILVVLARTVLSPASTAMLVPLVLVAALRAADVCLSVFKVTFTVSGRRAAAGAAAACEAAVWLVAADIVLADLSTARVAAYAIGVGGGTMLGMGIVRALRLGTVTVRAFVPVTERPHAGDDLAALFRANGAGATVFRGRGRDGEVDMVLSVVRRREAYQLSRLARRLDGRATIAIDNDPAPGSIVAARQR